MVEAGVAPNEVFGFAFDLLRDNVIALDQGYIHLVQDQQPFSRVSSPPSWRACLWSMVLAGFRSIPMVPSSTGRVWI
jgi:hypothetical protein